jgi:hypothetical protein
MQISPAQKAQSQHAMTEGHIALQKRETNERILEVGFPDQNGCLESAR